MTAEFHWARYADEWIRWARTPDHDAFWAYRDELREFLPSAGSATLDLGCGEGRVARELTALGHRVTAVDRSSRLLSAAREADSAAEYRLADAAALPFPDGAFDRVVAYNMLMDVPDADAVLAEAGRVLAAGGTLMVSVVHPFADTGGFDEQGRFVARRDYLQPAVSAGTFHRAGCTMHFDGWVRPLQAYVAGLCAAGLAVTELREPSPRRVDAVAGGMTNWTRMPLFLWLHAQHRG